MKNLNDINILKLRAYLQTMSDVGELIDADLINDEMLEASEIDADMFCDNISDIIEMLDMMVKVANTHGRL